LGIKPSFLRKLAHMVVGPTALEFVLRLLAALLFNDHLESLDHTVLLLDFRLHLSVAMPEFVVFID
jgi:hypothetical protein